MEEPAENSEKEKEEPQDQKQVEEEQGEKEIDIEKVIEEAEVEKEEEKEKTEEAGLATALNNAFGRILTLDLDPEKEETNKLRQQLQGLAEDVRLGHNTNRFLQKYVMTTSSPDPTTAMAGSMIAARTLALAIRPNLIGKIKTQILNKDKEAGGGEDSEERS